MDRNFDHQVYKHFPQFFLFSCFLAATSLSEFPHQSVIVAFQINTTLNSTRKQNSGLSLYRQNCNVDQLSNI